MFQWSKEALPDDAAVPDAGCGMDLSAASDDRPHKRGIL